MLFEIVPEPKGGRGFYGKWLSGGDAVVRLGFFV